MQPDFSDLFDPVSEKQWKQRVQYELDGQDYNQTLVKELPDGIRVTPIYGQATPRIPVFGFRETQICQDIFAFHPEKSRHRAYSSLKRGAGSLRLRIPNPNVPPSELLKQMDLEGKTVFFEPEFLSSEYLQKIIEATRAANGFPIVCTDPIGHLATNGNWFPGGDNFRFLSQSSASCPENPLVAVNARTYHNAGASPVQQIGFALAHALEYLNRFTTGQPLVIEWATGPDIFMETAKLRAFRWILRSLAPEFDGTAEPILYVETGKRGLRLFDAPDNWRHNAAAATAAFLGGADHLSVLPHDILFKKSNALAETAARNQGLSLQREVFNAPESVKVLNSPYLDSLTAQLAEKGLDLLKRMENEGGFLQLLQSGQLQRQLRQQAEKQENAFRNRKDYPPSGAVLPEMELYPFLKKKPRKTLVVPILERRIAEDLEKAHVESLDATTT